MTPVHPRYCLPDDEELYGEARFAIQRDRENEDRAHKLKPTGAANKDRLLRARLRARSEDRVEPITVRIRPVTGGYY